MWVIPAPRKGIKTDYEKKVEFSKLRLFWKEHQSYASNIVATSNTWLFQFKA